MKKTNWMIGLFILLVITFLIKPFLQETFISRSSIGTGNIGYELHYRPQLKIPNEHLFGNMRYPGKAYLSIAEPTEYLYNNNSDDTISFFSFPFFQK